MLYSPSTAVCLLFSIGSSPDTLMNAALCLSCEVNGMFSILSNDSTAMQSAFTGNSIASAYECLITQSSISNYNQLDRPSVGLYSSTRSILTHVPEARINRSPV